MNTSTELLSALSVLPQEWALTPVNQKKAYFTDWQETGLARESIEKELTSARAEGFGILTGKLSGGLIAIDCDGPQPHAKFREILGEDIPQTVSFASGKEGRAQYIFQYLRNIGLASTQRRTAMLRTAVSSNGVGMGATQFYHHQRISKTRATTGLTLLMTFRSRRCQRKPFSTC